MTDDVERAMWVEEKERVLQDVMGWIWEYLDEKDEQEEGWKEREVRKLKHSWEKRWKTYGEMNVRDRESAGWILDV